MTEPTELLRDPRFKALLRRRSHWRWGLSGGLVGSYLVYVVAGIYIPGIYALPFAGTSIPWGVVLGYLIIAMSIVLSVLYIRVVDKLKSAAGDEQEPHR